MRLQRTDGWHCCLKQRVISGEFLTPHKSHEPSVRPSSPLEFWVIAGCVRCDSPQDFAIQQFPLLIPRESLMPWHHCHCHFVVLVWDPSGSISHGNGDGVVSASSKSPVCYWSPLVGQVSKTGNDLRQRARANIPSLNNPNVDLTERPLHTSTRVTIFQTFLLCK